MGRSASQCERDGPDVRKGRGGWAREPRAGSRPDRGAARFQPGGARRCSGDRDTAGGRAGTASADAAAVAPGRERRAAGLGFDRRSTWENRPGTGLSRRGRRCRCRSDTTSSGRMRAKSAFAPPRCLRPIGGGDVLWRDEPREVVAANVSEPPSRIWNVRAPRAEGTYVLEVQRRLGADGRP